MSRQLTGDQVRRLRLRAQQLDDWGNRPALGVAQVVSKLCGVQAQDAAAAALSVRVRRAGLLAADVERALGQERSIVRTWAMRGTLHLVAAEDLGWLLGLLGPVFIRSNRGRRAELGLDEDTSHRALLALRAVLGEHGPQTREEIVERLASRGIRLEGQARPHLLGLASLEGLICHGPDRGRQPTYVLLSDWVRPGPALPPEVALARLATRYLAAYAPAAPGDFSAWSGLSMREARAAWQAISSRLVEVRLGEAPAWLLADQAGWLEAPAAPGPAVRLLPAFDTFLLGYRSRDLHLDPRFARRIAPGGGMLNPTLLVDGWLSGVWRLKRLTGRLECIIEPFEGLAQAVHAGLEAEVADLAHFLGAKADLTLRTPG
jgi:hypothetical protein